MRVHLRVQVCQQLKLQVHLFSMQLHAVTQPLRPSDPRMLSLLQGWQAPCLLGCPPGWEDTREGSSCRSRQLLHRPS